MKPTNTGSFRGVWALAWRSFVFFPFGVAFATLLLSVVVALFMLPVIGAACVYYGLWLYAGIVFAVWLALVWCWRRFHLAEFFEGPPSLL
jgi:hypothetical protein